MIGYPSEEWFKNQMLEVEKDPRSHAECVLLDITENICEMYGQPKGIYRLLFYLLNWSADKLIWRETSPNKPLNPTSKDSAG